MEANSPVVLLDGGFSSQLSYHVNTDAEYANHPLWCARYLVTDPESVIKTHRDYIKVLVAGSIGSYGACLHDGSEYHGNYAKNVSRDVLKNWHRPRMSALVESGVDFLAIETIPALIEAEIILELLHEFPNQKAWISFTCENGHTTVAHDRIGYAANKLWSTSENQLVAIGVNCLKPSFVTPLLNAIREANSVQESSLTSSTRIPTIAYPNSGENYDITEQSSVITAQTDRTLGTCTYTYMVPLTREHDRRLDLDGWAKVFLPIGTPTFYVPTSTRYVASRPDAKIRSNYSTHLHAIRGGTRTADILQLPDEGIAAIRRRLYRTKADFITPRHTKLCSVVATITNGKREVGGRLARTIESLSFIELIGTARAKSANVSKSRYSSTSLSRRHRASSF
ncbi:tetraacyldisaccharide 4'-kinase [Sarracenia purpurea var. burkii]